MKNKEIGVVFRDETSGWVKDYKKLILEEMNLDTTDLSFNNTQRALLSNTLSLADDMYRKCKDSDADLIHFLSSAYCKSPRKLSFNEKKTIVTVQDLFPFYGENLKSKIFAKLAKRNLKSADHLIAISEFTKRDLISRMNIIEDKITVIPLSIDKDLYRPVETNKLELPENYLLYVGGDFERKNLEFLIKLHSEILENYESLHLVLTGPIGEDKQIELNKLAEELGSKEKVVFTDWIDEEDMPELYSRAKVYVQPSKKEGQGIPPVEAMACGTPPIVSNKTALPETVGKSELVVELEAEKFERKIIELIENKELYQEMKKYGIERSKYFSKSSIIKEHKKLYREL